MRPLTVGIFLTPWIEGKTASVPRWADIRDRARLAEEVGFDSLWISDHLLIRLPGEAARGGWEGWSLLAALAASTSRAQLGTLVVSTNFRNPALLAKMADTVDEISRGRLILGLGAGWHEPEYRAFGFPYDHRVSRFEEALQIIATLVREGAIDFQGTYYQARECELRPWTRRPNRPPIMVGALRGGRRMLRLTATYADLWNAWLVWARSRANAVPPLRAAVDAACLAAGRDPASLGRTVAVQIDLPGAIPSRELGIEPLVGSPHQLADALRAFAVEGISQVQIQLNPNSLAAIEAFAPTLALLDGDRQMGGKRRSGHQGDTPGGREATLLG